MNHYPSQQFFENITLEVDPSQFHFSKDTNIHVYEFQEKYTAKTEDQFFKEQQDEGHCLTLVLSLGSKKNENIPLLDAKLPQLLFPNITDSGKLLGIPCSLYSQNNTKLFLTLRTSYAKQRGYSLETLLSLRSCNLLSPILRQSLATSLDPHPDSHKNSSVRPPSSAIDLQMNPAKVPALTSYIQPEDATTLLSLKIASTHAVFVHDEFSLRIWKEHFDRHPAESICVSEKFLKDIKKIANPSLKIHSHHSLKHILCNVGACRACANVQDDFVYTVCRQGMLQKHV